MNGWLKVTLCLAASSLAVAGAASASSADRSAGSADALARAAQATTKYHAIGSAKQAGYGLLKDAKGIACITQMAGMPKMGAMGIHYAKSSLVGDGAISATKPEALVYEPVAKGKLQLVAVEYVVLKSAWDAKHASPPALFGKPFNFTPAGNRFGLPAYYSLHAWIWKHNPSGEFSMWNPDVSCAAA
jgi:hypothetical protein